MDFFRDAKEPVIKDSFEGIPALDVLLKNGFKSIAEVKAHPDLTQINGIGKATAEAIATYLKKLEDG